MNENQRVSAEVMRWQLQTIANEEPYLDYSFPLEQFQGANVGLVNFLIFTRPLATPGDAENYVAALGQVSTRLQEAMAESQRLATKGVLPPKFILQATIDQMNRFTESSAAQNPLVTVLGQKTDAMKELPAVRRQALLSQAEGIVGRQSIRLTRKRSRSCNRKSHARPMMRDCGGLKEALRHIHLLPAPLHHDEHDARTNPSAWPAAGTDD